MSAAFTSLLAYIMVIAGFTQDIIDLPVTFNFKTRESAKTDPNQATWYYASLCPKGISNKKQAVLQAFLSENAEWNCTARPIVLIQVSICDNDFSEKCVIATNYKWGTQVIAVPNISWTMNNESVYYIRTMGWNQGSEFSMELSFTNTANIFSYPWTTNNPFMVPTMTTPASPLNQYWKSNTEHTVGDEGYAKFSIAYCNQGRTIKGIDVSLTATPKTNDYSLMQQWACPQTVPIDQCSNANSISVGWNNFGIASFNLMQCIEETDRTTVHGIYVVIQGDGANINGINTFSLYASQYGT